jgi:hypothetical protein
MVEHQVTTTAGSVKAFTEAEAICGLAKVLASFQATRDDEVDEENPRGPSSRFLFSVVQYSPELRILISQKAVMERVSIAEDRK